MIESHIHQKIDSVIRILWGSMRGQIGDKRGVVTDLHDWLRAFHIPAGVVHSAYICEFTVFMNWERWTGDLPVKSAVDDFTAV